MINVGEVILLNKMDSLCVLQSYLYIYLKKIISDITKAYTFESKSFGLDFFFSQKNPKSVLHAVPDNVPTAIY